MPEQLLLFGGTFDPPHRAHVELPRAAAVRLGADRVVYLPAARNPQKDAGQVSSDDDRLAMLRLALRDAAWATISTVELDRGGASFFAETVEAVAAERPADTRIRFLIGADHAISFHTWDRWRRILELAEPAVMLRPPWDRRAFRAVLAETYDPDEAAWWDERALADLPMLDISATDVRARIAAGEPPGALAGLVDPAVVEYARTHHLYDDAPRPVARPRSGSGLRP